MTYLFFVNGNYFDSTRTNDEAFRWLREWRELGHDAGLKFVRDDDNEALRWLVPPDALQQMRSAA